MQRKTNGRNDIEVARQGADSQEDTVVVGIRLAPTDLIRLKEQGTRRGLKAGTVGRLAIMEWLAFAEKAA